MRKFFKYHPKGWLIRKKSPGKRGGRGGIPGQIVKGSVGSNGYRFFNFRNKEHLRIHRAIFSLVKGCLPYEIDHINGDRQDNRIENLRSVDHVKNQLNIITKKYGKNRAIYYRTWDKRWTAYMQIYGKPHRVYAKTKKECTKKFKKLRKQKLKELGLI